MLKHSGQNGNPVPQVGIDPTVLAETLRGCVGGPCDGQSMRCPATYILFVTPAVDGLRATALPRETTVRFGPGDPMPVDLIALARKVGSYIGHYELEGEILVWRAESES